MPTIDSPPQPGMFRTDVTNGAERVDRKANIIFGASLMQLGDLNDGDARDWTVDERSLGQALELMGRGNNGTKARYTHPNMSSDGMGSYLGRWKNPRTDGGTLRADLHIADSAFTSPLGDLGTYVLDLAEEDPEAFGTSLATRLDQTNLAEFEDSQREERRLARKKGEATPDRKRWPMRFSGIRAADVVDEPAATRSGFFGITEIDNRNLPAQATLLLDSYFSEAEPEVVTARVNGFLATYFKSKGRSMSETSPAAETETETPATDTETVDLAAETKKAADLARKQERDRQTKITELCVQAGKPELSAKFCEDGTSVVEVQSQLLQELCKSNPPVGDEGGTAADAEPDEDAEFKKEFKSDPDYAKTMTEEQFVSLRRSEEGLDPFIKPDDK